MLPDKVIVSFDMWGQRCTTSFDSSSELDPFTWINTCLQKGWLRPVEILSEDGKVLYTQEQLWERYKDVF